MPRPRPMKFEWRSGGTPGVMLLAVEHEDWQSFSRAVDPQASKRANRELPPGAWSLVKVDYGQDHPEPHRCVSVYRYERWSAA